MKMYKKYGFAKKIGVIIYMMAPSIGLKWVKNLSNIYALQDKSCCSTCNAVNHEDLKASGLIIQLRFSFLYH